VIPINMIAGFLLIGLLAAFGLSGCSDSPGAQGSWEMVSGDRKLPKYIKVYRADAKWWVESGMKTTISGTRAPLSEDRVRVELEVQQNPDTARRKIEDYLLRYDVHDDGLLYVTEHKHDLQGKYEKIDDLEHYQPPT